MEFTLKTLVVIVLLLIGALVIIAFIQVWSGRSMDIMKSTYDFFNNMLGLKS